MELYGLSSAPPPLKITLWRQKTSPNGIILKIWRFPWLDIETFLVIKQAQTSSDRKRIKNSLKTNGPHIKTSQLICQANQLTGFYDRGTLVVKRLIEK